MPDGLALIDFDGDDDCDRDGDSVGVVEPIAVDAREADMDNVDSVDTVEDVEAVPVTDTDALPVPVGDADTADEIVEEDVPDSEPVSDPLRVVVNDCDHEALAVPATVTDKVVLAVGLSVEKPDGCVETDSVPELLDVLSIVTDTVTVRERLIVTDAVGDTVEPDGVTEAEGLVDGVGSSTSHTNRRSLCHNASLIPAPATVQ